MTNATFDPFVGTLTTNNMPSCTSQRLRIFSTMKNKNNYMMGHTPLQVVEKERDMKKIWEWLFQLVMPFVGRKKYEE